MKTVVVTGSTRGIGLGLAENFLKRGCKVVVSGRNQVAVDHVVGRLAEEYGADNVAGAACEISDADSVQGLWDAAAAAFGSVDVWINNAGVSSARVNLKDADPADISSVVNINLAGLLLARPVLAHVWHALKRHWPERFDRTRRVLRSPGLRTRP